MANANPMETNNPNNASFICQNAPEDMLKECLCKLCDCYLSIGPIRMIGEEMICGRCVGDGMRAFAYEAIAKQMKFPCRYKALGCTSYLSWGRVHVHEEACDFKLLECVETDCFWKGQRAAHLQHFQGSHLEQVIDDNTITTINMNINKQVCLLHVRGDSMSSVHLIVDDNVVRHCVRVFANEDVKKYVYDMTLSNATMNVTYMNQKVQHISDMSFWNERLHQEGIRSVFTGLNELNVNIKLCGIVENEKITRHDVECPICLNKMMGDIIILDCGHSLCSSCNGIDTCPLCRADVERATTRNYALESLIKKVHLH